MNHLAHIYLSYGHESILPGNFFCDFLTLAEQREMPEGYAGGFKLHRWIDDYTDSHKLVAEMRNILRPASGKYAGVIADILMDHQLVKFWNLFGEISYDEYCDVQYLNLEKILPMIPELTASKVKHMIRDQWLHSFAHVSGMEFTFKLLAQRAKYRDSFAEVMPLYKENESKLDGLFMEFFPELCGYVVLRLEEFNLQSGN
jgi:acyl carrier protein phosphodiesterase